MILDKENIKSGIVMITKWKPEFSFFRHLGIITIENGTAYVYHNDPDNPINAEGGSPAKTAFDDYIKKWAILEFYDSGLTSEKIKNEASKYWHKKFNFVTFNCRQFIKRITGKSIQEKRFFDKHFS